MNPRQFFKASTLALSSVALSCKNQPKSYLSSFLSRLNPMNCGRVLPLIALVAVLAATSQAATSLKPIALHPDNPHYFLWRGKPAVLITSGEHYGAVLNLDFDFVPYLDTL